jgi:two-component system NtrC family sensor kinase
MTQDNRLTDHYYQSLNRNIILIIIIVSVIPMILVSSTIYLQFRSSYHEKVYDHLRELVDKHKDDIDIFLQERLTDIRIMARSFGYESLSDESFLQERLATHQQEYGPYFVDLGVINSQGRQVAYAGPFKLGKAQYSDAKWFREVLRNEYVISDVFLGLRGLPHFIVAVRNTKNNETWILRATIDFVAFNTLVENIHLGQTGFAFILNREGKFQTGPITKPSLNIVANKTIYSEFLNSSTFDPNEISVVVKPDSSNHNSIYVTSRLKNEDWLLVYQQRVADAFADLDNTFKRTTVIMLLGPLAVVIMAFTLSRMIVKRIAISDEEKQLMNKKVVEAGRLASVGELAAGVAHEINNPVAIMVEEAGWLGDLLEDEDGCKDENISEFKRAIEQIKTQGKRCKEITQKLLSFARKTDDSAQDVEINELLEELVALSAQRAKYSLVEITTKFQKNLPHLKLSLSELQQVFLNLINNALDAMEGEGGKLNLTTRQNENYIVVEVCDTGEGIPEANLNRIFDPFFTTKPVGKGSGLGLSICYGIVEKMGGKIEVKSSVGAGTTFYVFIPGPRLEVSKT